MPNYVDFPVTCRLNRQNTENLRVYYVLLGGKWLPLPPNICANGCGAGACNRCVAEVIERALRRHPPFPE